MPIFNFFLGLICSIGFYPLFYKMNRPATRWRSIALLVAVIVSRPLCLLWQSYYLEHGQNTVMLIGVAVILDVLSLLIFVLLGANRSQMLVTASFIYSVISIAQIPVVYYIAAIVYPLINVPNLYEAADQFPQLYYSGLFFNNVIIIGCCFFATHWIKKTQSKPPQKMNVFFCILFILFSFIVLVWWSDIVKIMSISFLSSALLGTLLLGILLLLFYLYTQLVVNTNIKTGDYAQYIQNLSKRELEVVEALLAGNDSYKKLSVALNISVNTVKTHLKHIYQTTNVSNITALSKLFLGYNQNHP